MTYRYKTKPFSHQHEEFTRHGADYVRGLFWEPGVGKTKPILDSFAYLVGEKEISGLVVIAPNGVHRNWVSDEIEAHLPEDVADRLRSHVWYSTSAKYHADHFADTLGYDGPAALVMSYHAVWTEKGGKAWKAFLKGRRCLYALDESQRVKSPNAKWSKRLLGSNVASPYKRVLSGTPVANSPFDLYNQLRFLDPDVWKKYGIPNYTVFKSFFGVWDKKTTRQGKEYPVCITYRNMDILNEELHRLGSRITKDEVLDLSPKMYSKRYVELTPYQKRIYKSLVDECAVMLDAGELTAELALVRLLRLQQVVCGYLPASDDDDTLVDIQGGNPRLDLLSDVCEDLPHKAIVWVRFRRDAELISGHKTFVGRSVRVDGTVTGPARDRALDRFKKDSSVQFLIGNPAAIGEGHTLNMAKTVVYYSNSFNLVHRLQSEDRCHRIGQDSKVHYIDFVASGTVDTKIVQALREKVNVASCITGDTLREWI